VDYRHPPTNNDITMARWFMDTGCPFFVVANKVNKLGSTKIAPNMKVIRQDLELGEEVPLIPFSAEKGTGKDELVKYILSAAE
jgi:GTP-binding protein